MADGEPPYPAQVQRPLPNPTIIHRIGLPSAAGLVPAHAAKAAG